MADTRGRLLAEAERLYAERGLDGVSLREITEAAGQRNNAAVHYHFGGRDGLVQALFEHRYAQLEARRADMLAALPDDHGIRDLVRVLVAPFAEAADGPEGHWVRFVARLHEDARFNPFAGDHPYAASDEAIAVSGEVSRRIRKALDLSDAEADARLYLVTTLTVHAVADRQVLRGSGLPTGAELTEALVEAAIAILTG